MSVNWTTVSNIAVTGACAMFVALGGLRIKDSVTPRTSPSMPTPIRDVIDSVSIADAESQGKADANVVLIEFSDFQCPYCARHAQNVFKVLKSEFMDRGTLQYAFMHFPLESHTQSAKVSEAAKCAGQQGEFWRMHDLLFDIRDPNALAPSGLIAGAKQLGLSIDKFTHCLAGSTTQSVRRSIEEGKRIGVTSTPTFFVGRRQPDGSVQVDKQIVGAHPAEVFRTAISQILAE